MSDFCSGRSVVSPKREFAYCHCNALAQAREPSLSETSLVTWAKASSLSENSAVLCFKPSGLHKLTHLAALRLRQAILLQSWVLCVLLYALMRTWTRRYAMSGYIHGW